MGGNWLRGDGRRGEDGGGWWGGGAAPSGAVGPERDGYVRFESPLFQLPVPDAHR